VAIHYAKGEDHIVLITIDRPEAKNSADMEHFKQLREAWERFGADDDAWVAIITGVGDAFFTGADLKRYIPEITKLQEQIKQGQVAEGGVAEIDGYRLDDGVKAVLRNVELYKPIIAAVNGFCTAGGMEMLGGVDIRIACPEAKFAVMEPKRGLFAGGGTTVRLPRQIPWPQAMEMLLCADDARRAGVEGHRACQLGGRFSANASGPSFASSVRKMVDEIRLSFSNAVTSSLARLSSTSPATVMAKRAVAGSSVRTVSSTSPRALAALRTLATCISSEYSPWSAERFVACTASGAFSVMRRANS
jgi:enoyl-CoA hydratase/carnithine racemase